MAENQPKPPEGMQRPGIPGAGNLLDPAVRGELREKIQEAGHGAKDQVQQQGAEKKEDMRPAAAPAPAAAQHGQNTPGSDLDLSFISANVPPGPVKPQRAKADRRFYFLAQDAAPGSDGPNQSAPAPKPPANPKPG